MPNISYKIIKNLGEISDSKKGWKKELNYISWNNGVPKYDLRDWAPDHEKMGKGITLTEEEARALLDILEREF